MNILKTEDLNWGILDTYAREMDRAPRTNDNDAISTLTGWDIIEPEPNCNSLIGKTLCHLLVTYHTKTLVQQAVQRNIRIRSTLLSSRRGVSCYHSHSRNLDCYFPNTPIQ